MYHSNEVWGSKAAKPLAQHTPPWPECFILEKIDSKSWKLTKNLTEILSDQFWRCFGSPRKGWWLSWTCLHSWKCMLRQSCATWHWLVHKPGCFFLRAGCILRTWTIFRKMCDWIHETYHTWSGFAWISLSLCSVQTLWIYKRCRRLSVENNFVETLTW